MSSCQKGFAHIFLVLVIVLVGIGVVGYYAFKNEQIKSINNKNTGTNEDSELTPTNILNGKITVFADKPLKLASGVILRIGSLMFSEKAPEEERLPFDKEISVYSNGFLHQINGVECKKETKFFDDYSLLVTTQCDMNITMEKTEVPDIPAYKNFELNFYSVANKNIPRYTAYQHEPFIGVSVPYFQIAKMDDKPSVNVVSPKEDKVSVYTKFGRHNFQFTTEELVNGVEKSIDNDGVSIKLTPTKLDCSPPYKEGDGSCYTLKYQGSRTSTHNLVKFNLLINEADNVSKENRVLFIH